MHAAVDSAEASVAEIGHPLAHGVAREVDSVTHQEVLLLAVVRLVIAEAVGGNFSC
jgi:hypothetical protein